MFYSSTNIKQFKEAENQVPSEKAIKSVKFDNSGIYLALGLSDGNLQVYEVSNEKMKAEISAHDNEILSIDFTFLGQSLQKRVIATGSRDRLIHIFVFQDNRLELLQSVDAHSAAVNSVRFCRGTEKLMLLSSAADKQFILQEWKEDKKAFVKSKVDFDNKHKIFCIAVLGEKNLVAVGQEKQISIWNMVKQELKTVIETKETDKSTSKPFYLDNLRIALDSSGTFLAVSNQDKTVRIRDLSQSGAVIASTTIGNIVTGISFANATQQLITSTVEGFICVWKLSEEMKRSIKNKLQKKKNKLNLIGQQMKEALGKNNLKWTLNSNFMESEVQQQQQVEVKLQEENNQMKQKTTEEELDELCKNSSLPQWAQTQYQQEPELQSVLMDSKELKKMYLENNNSSISQIQQLQQQQPQQPDSTFVQIENSERAMIINDTTIIGESMFEDCKQFALLNKEKQEMDRVFYGKEEKKRQQELRPMKSSCTQAFREIHQEPVENNYIGNTKNDTNMCDTQFENILNDIEESMIIEKKERIDDSVCNAELLHNLDKQTKNALFSKKDRPAFADDMNWIQQQVGQVTKQIEETEQRLQVQKKPNAPEDVLHTQEIEDEPTQIIPSKHEEEIRNSTVL
eukprot:TRINITY_DN13827_c0_g1_i2.p1 TRINITY_DN13827_c0_g1~~TRINITY_DN13827_c0_g1_i2.p1  ORF type:complete len:627 (+),score=118.11 TRINITY_DN13827_c0_g1_i2:301-2181(+)